MRKFWRGLLELGSVPMPGALAGGYVVCFAWGIFTLGFGAGAHLTGPIGWASLWVLPYLVGSAALMRLGEKFQRRMKWAQGE